MIPKEIKARKETLLLVRLLFLALNWLLATASLLIGGIRQTGIDG
jgi:hypothetical protein